MPYQWKLPDVGEGIHEAEMTRIWIRENQLVEVDQLILEIQTDKALVEISSPVKGKVTKINISEGQLVRVGTVVFEFENADEISDSLARPAVQERFEPNSGNKKSKRVLTTPYVRKLAREFGIDLQEVIGTGVGGRITEEDLRSHQNKKPPFPNDDSKGKATDVLNRSRIPVEQADLEERIPLRGLRRTIAERMVQSKFTAPHVTGMDEVDVTELVKLRKQAEAAAAEQGVKVTYLPFIIKAVISGLKKYPYLNASIDPELNEIIVKRYYHIGIAVDTPEGLVVPVIKNADTKSILEIAAELSLLKEKAFNRSLKLEDLKGSTFTISNIGSFGGIYATPIINYPEVAIMATGKISRRPLATEDDSLIFRDIMSVSVTFDHRVIDGGTSARFTHHVRRYLENPILQLLEMV